MILALLLWAGLYHVAKPVAEASDPYLVAFLRYLIAALLLLLILRVRSGSFIPKLQLKQWFLVACIGLIGICVYNLLFFNAEALISGNIVAILYSFTPCLTTIISAFVFKTKLNWLSKCGVMIALIGSIGVVNYATPECQQFFCTSIFKNVNRGEVYGILATVVFACYSVLSRYTSQQGVSGLVINTYSSLIGAAFLGVLALLKADFSHLGSYSLNFWFAMGYMSFFATVLAYLWYTDAIIHLGVFKTVVFQNTIPLQTIVIGYVFFAEKIGLDVLLCGIIVVAGVYLTNFGLTLRSRAKRQV